MSKFSQLFALASKTGTTKKTTVRADTADGKVSAKMDGFPAELTAVGLTELASKVGIVATFDNVVGLAKGRSSATITGDNAGKFVTLTMADETESA